MEIRKERIVLRTLSDSQVQECMLREKIPMLRDNFEKMLRGLESYPKERIWYTLWNIELKETKEVIGKVGFRGHPTEKGEVEIAIYVEERYRGNGYARETIKLICEWALKQEKVNYVRACFEDTNVPYQKILERTGFSLVSKVGMYQVWEKKKTINYRSIVLAVAVLLGFVLTESMFQNGIIGAGMGAICGAFLVRSVGVE